MCTHEYLKANFSEQESQQAPPTPTYTYMHTHTPVHAKNLSVLPGSTEITEFGSPKAITQQRAHLTMAATLLEVSTWLLYRKTKPQSNCSRCTEQQAKLRVPCTHLYENIKDLMSKIKHLGIQIIHLRHKYYSLGPSQACWETRLGGRATFCQLHSGSTGGGEVEARQKSSLTLWLASPQSFFQTPRP